MVLTVIIAVFFGHHLWQDRDIQAIPNSDLFQYLDDGHQYLDFRLPQSIQPPPFAPILITFTARLIPKTVSYPEITAAHLVNIILASLGLINIYLLGSYFLSPLTAFLLTLLVASNQIYILYGLDVTSEVIYAFFLTFSLIIYHHSKKPFVYLLFGLLFLIRYESIVIPISVFIIEYFSRKNSLKIKNVVIAFVPIILWLIVLQFHSDGHSLIDNAYLIEIINGIKKLPNSLTITSLVDIITFDPSPISNLKELFALVLLYLCFYGATNKRLPPLTKIIYLIFGLNLLFLYAFPNFVVRYYVPIIWITYLILINQKSRLIAFTLFFCLLTYNLERINLPSTYSQPNDMKEYRLVANWFNQQPFSQNTKILIYEPWILNYFLHQKYVIVQIEGQNQKGQDIDTLIAGCHHQLICTAAQLNQKYYQSSDIFIVTTSNSSQDLNNNNDKFNATQHMANVFSQFPQPSDLNYFRLITTLGNPDHWAKIYQYTP